MNTPQFDYSISDCTASAKHFDSLPAACMAKISGVINTQNSVATIATMLTPPAAGTDFLQKNSRLPCPKECEMAAASFLHA